MILSSREVLELGREVQNRIGGDSKKSLGDRAKASRGEAQKYFTGGKAQGVRGLEVYHK